MSVAHTKVFVKRMDDLITSYVPNMDDLITKRNPGCSRLFLKSKRKWSPFENGGQPLLPGLQTLLLCTGVNDLEDSYGIGVCYVNHGKISHALFTCLVHQAECNK